jgi:uncharacterized protein YdcH (DUF465 family)
MIGCLREGSASDLPGSLLAPSRRCRRSFHDDREVPMITDSLRQQLLASHDEYRRLEQQHQDFESRLSTLSEKVLLSDDEQVEETTLKKKKLQLKDRMEAIAREARDGVHP